jgi:hypothetical protein
MAIEASLSASATRSVPLLARLCAIGARDNVHPRHVRTGRSDQACHTPKF